MKLETKAVNVLERTSNYLKSRVLSQKPVWYDVVAAHPPNKSFIRQPRQIETNQPINVQKSHLNKKNKPLYKTRESQKIARNIYKPQKLRFVEDALRNLFYEQHPWELARPKILLENTRVDSTKQNWSSIVQHDKQLDGESVVQRTIYLLNEKDNQRTLSDAYDQARFEFYRIRIEQEIQGQVAQEENEMFGATFAESALEHGIKQEQKVIDEWKIKATELSDIQTAKNSSGPSA